MSEDKLKVIIKPPIGGFRKGISANMAIFEQELNKLDPKTVPNRLGLVLDDSGSMGTEGMENAHSAVKNFTSSCSMKETSIAVYPLNVEAKPLTCDYDLLNMYVLGIKATGGTPLYGALRDLIEKEDITRAIAFSDGQPTDSHLISSSDSYYLSQGSGLALEVVSLYVEKKISVDTIFIGQKDSDNAKELQELAKQTGGTFVCFEDTKTLSSSLKYLSPRYRALLSNPEIKARVEHGEQI